MVLLEKRHNENILDKHKSKITNKTENVRKTIVYFIDYSGF